MASFSPIPDLSITAQDPEQPANPLLPVVDAVAPIAGFWRRFAAWIVDSILLGIAGQIIGWTFSSFWFEVGPYGRFVGLFFILFYFGLMNSWLGNGQTLGKRFLGVAVRDDENRPISIERSMIRTTILALPFILNGWALPIFQNVVLMMLLSVIIFGLGGAIVYTMIFNRGARQGLHDLLCRTYVVYLGGDPLPAFPQSRKIHKTIAGVILAVSVVLMGIMGVASTFVTSESSFAYLYKPYQTLLSDPRFFSASVFDNTFYSGQAKSTHTLRVNVWYKGVPNREEFARIINDVANVVLKDLENIDDFDLIEISITSGYDLGIASGSSTSGDRQSPEVWRERIRSANIK
ncbi:MAG: RDD family protein [Pyrinomonadaceae bacterium]|nr:RDD family protein [Pyrinomonadaceae bacterium]